MPVKFRDLECAVGRGEVPCEEEKLTPQDFADRGLARVGRFLRNELNIEHNGRAGPVAWTGNEYPKRYNNFYKRTSRRVFVAEWYGYEDTHNLTSVIDWRWV